jgi:hypothetical protein
MRVICPHCLKKALIASSNALSNQVKDLYCKCTNTEACGASFVYTLSYKNTINPPVHTTTQIAFELVNRLSKEEKAAFKPAIFP